MSYLTLANGIPDFSQVVISFWFRAPRESVIAAATNKVESGLADFAMMQGILPLLTFGAPQVSKHYPTFTHNVAEVHQFLPGEPPPGTSYNAIGYTQGPSYNVDPSYIGLSCSTDGQFRLEFNIQTAAFMSLASTGFVTTRMDIWSGSDPGAPKNTSPGSGVVQLGLNLGIAAFGSATYVDNRRPEFFNVHSSGSYQPDRWHHVLLSFDIGNSLSIGHPFPSSMCRLWYAIDDVDYRGAQNMQPFRDTGDGMDPNAILTSNAYRLSGVNPNDPNSYLYQNTPVALPSGSYSGATVPTEGAALGLPSSAKYVDAIFRVEMAELQIFTGVTLDTKSESSRRAFVDKAGEPVDPTTDPIPPAVQLLGKRPAVLLHGSDNWKDGYNTGSTGTTIVDGTEVKLTKGQFTRTAAIEAFKPEPALGG